MTKQCRDGDITISAAKKVIEVYFDDILIARSQAVLALHEAGHQDRYYFPRDDVDGDALQPSAHHTTCPYKGEASYYHLCVEDKRLENAAWSYLDPCPQVMAIGGYVAFWGERVSFKTLT